MVDAPGSHAAGNRSRCGAVSWYVRDNENDTDGRIPEFPAGVTPERTDRTDREVVVKQKTRAGSIAVPLMVMLLLGGAIANPVPGVLKGLVVGAPVSHGNLTLFPLDGRATGSTVYATLDKAIRKGWVEVREKDGGDVNTVRVRNKSDKPVFGMAGEIITGAKQNRMLEHDVLLPSESGWLDLPVYCVEHGRWHGAGMEFGSKGQIAAGRVRGKAAKDQSQSSVWAEVAENNEELGVVTSTGRFDAVYDDKTVQDGLREYKDELHDRVPELAPNALGVAVVVGNRLVCVDAFSSPAMFRKMWSRLLDSYVIDALSRQPSGKMTRQQVSDFLKEAAAASIVQQPTVGGGQLMRIEGDEATGSALVSGKEVIHLDLFPADESESTPMRLDIRREGSQR